MTGVPDLPPVGTIVRLSDSDFYHKLAQGKLARITDINHRDHSRGSAEILEPERDEWGGLVREQYIEADLLVPVPHSKTHGQL